MLKQIIDFLNLRLSVLNYFEELFCLCELKSDGEVKQPMQRGSNGEWRKVNFDEWNGVSYWRLRDDISTDEVPSLVAGKRRFNRVFPLRLVVAVPRAKVTVDDAYSFQRLAVSIEKVLTVQLGDLQNQLGAGRVTLAVNTEKADAKDVWDSETDGTLQFEPKYELLYGALDVTVTVTADVACFVSECDNPDTDILHTFDFCKPTVRERLTDEQIACLEAALCETPPTLCEQLAEVSPDNVVADVFDCLSPEAQDALLEAECPTCEPLTINFDGDLLQTISEPCGQTVNLNCNTNINAAYVEDGGSVTGVYALDGTLNGKPVYRLDITHNLEYNGTAWELVKPGSNIVASNGNENYPWLATWPTIVVTQATISEYCSECDPCADATANLFNTVPTLLSTTPIASGASANITAPNATAVLKDTANNTLSTTAIPSNVSQNITAPDATITLNGSAYGSAPSGATFNVTTTPPSLSVASSNATPTFGASVTLTATPTNITPISYTWFANGNQIGTGNGLVWSVNIAGAISITCVATDGTLTAQDTTSITSTVVRLSSFHLDGVNDRLFGYWSNRFTPSNGLCFSFRLKPTSASSIVALAFGTTFGGNYYAVYVIASNTTLSIEVWNDSSGFTFVGVPITTAWNHINIWMLPSSTGLPNAYSCLWVNGVFRQENTNILNAMRFSPRIIAVAHKVSDLCIFNTSLIGTASANLGALTQVDALQLYNSGNLQAIPGTTTGNLTRIAWWPCIESPKAPLTVLDTIVDIDNGAVLQPNANFASPFGLVNDIP